MGMIKDNLKESGYNTKERAYINGGAIAGALAPIVGTRYLLTAGIETNNPLVEGLVWGTSIAINLIPMGTLPFAAFGGIAGLAVGTTTAQSSKRKRNKENHFLNIGLESKDTETLERYNSRLEPSGFVDNIKYDLSKKRKRRHEKVQSILENRLGGGAE